MDCNGRRKNNLSKSMISYQISNKELFGNILENENENENKKNHIYIFFLISTSSILAFLNSYSNSYLTFSKYFISPSNFFFLQRMLSYLYYFIYI